MTPFAGMQTWSAIMQMVITLHADCMFASKVHRMLQPLPGQHCWCPSATHLCCGQMTRPKAHHVRAACMVAGIGDEQSALHVRPLHGLEQL